MQKEDIIKNTEVARNIMDEIDILDGEKEKRRLRMLAK